MAEHIRKDCLHPSGEDWRSFCSRFSNCHPGSDNIEELEKHNTILVASSIVYPLQKQSLQAVGGTP